MSVRSMSSSVTTASIKEDVFMEQATYLEVLQELKEEIDYVPEAQKDAFIMGFLITMML